MRHEQGDPTAEADPQPPGSDVAVGETVQALSPGMRGRWLVTTQGTTHLWDLDAVTYERRPGPHSRAGAFDHDRAAHPISRVELWPVVGGRSFLWFDDPSAPWLLEHYRD